jgi:hypothetical protein
MTNLTRTRGHSARRPSARLISEAVVASYIHDISERHRRAETAGQRESLELRRPTHGRRDPAAIRPRTAELHT